MASVMNAGYSDSFEVILCEMFQKNVFQDHFGRLRSFQIFMCQNVPISSFYLRLYDERSRDYQICACCDILIFWKIFKVNKAQILTS